MAQSSPRMHQNALFRASNCKNFPYPSSYVQGPHRRHLRALINSSISYSIFSPSTSKFGESPVFPSLMTATAFLLANSEAHFLSRSHVQELNLYTMSEGHFGTGKSLAIETALAAFCEIKSISKEVSHIF